MTRSALGSAPFHYARPNSEAIIAGVFGLEVIGVGLGLEFLEKGELTLSSNPQSWRD